MSISDQEIEERFSGLKPKLVSSTGSRKKHVMKNEDGTWDFKAALDAYSDGDYESALTQFQRGASIGDDDAQTALGTMYRKGQGTPINPSEAIRWYMAAAEQGNPIAQSSMGFCYANGIGLDQDYRQAIHWFVLAAEQNHSDAQCDLGKIYREGLSVDVDFDAALAWFQHAADQGNSIAQNYLAGMYENGEGVETDTSIAVRWYSESASRGFADAQVYLGVLYETGKGVTQNYKESIYWYQKAADQEFPAAYSLLGHMYFAGKGIARDEDTAIKLFTKSADLGDSSGQYNLGIILWGKSETDQDYFVASSWLLKASEQGHHSAIPTTRPMTPDEYQSITDYIMDQLVKIGFHNDKSDDKKSHGIDRTKLHPASLFFAPCQAQDPKDSFFTLYEGQTLNPSHWLPHIEKQKPKTLVTKPCSIVQNGPLSWIQTEGAKKAVEKYLAVPAGQGKRHSAYFNLARTLKWLGLNKHDRRLYLMEADYDGSRMKKGAIESIEKTLSKDSYR
jgi:TPR repeat protein